MDKNTTATELNAVIKELKARADLSGFKAIVVYVTGLKAEEVQAMSTNEALLALLGTMTAIKAIALAVVLVGIAVALGSLAMEAQRAKEAVDGFYDIVDNGDAYLDTAELIMNQDTVIVGKLSYLEKTKVTGLELAKIGSVETRKTTEVKVKVNPMTGVYAFVISLLAAYVVMAALFYIMPSTKEKLAKLEIKFDSVAKTVATGLAIFFVIPIVCLIAIFTGILTPLAIITLCIYGIALYLSSLLSSYIIGNLINTKLFKNNNAYLSLLIGIVLVRLVGIIPVIGFWIIAICALHGLGLIYKFINNSKK